MTKQHLINETYQVVDNGSVMFQGSEVDCNIFMLQNDISEKYNRALENMICTIPELSDYEIQQKAASVRMNTTPEYAFIAGARWYREQLKQKL